MTDANLNPEYPKPDDLPNKEDIEKPYYDDDSAPAIQNYNNYNQPMYYNPPPSNDMKTNDQQTQGQPYYNPNSNINNNYNYNNNYYSEGIQYNPPVPEQIPRRRGLGSNPTLLVILSILLIIIVIIDVILEIAFNIFSPFVTADDIAMLTMAIIYLILVKKGKSTHHMGLGAATIFVWFVGFGARGFGMTLLDSASPGYMIACFLLTGARAFVLFFCIPYTCGN